MQPNKLRIKLKVYLLGIILIGALHSCKTYTCEDYHVGKFEYDVSQFDEMIERTKTHQIETSDSLNYQDKFKIEWTDDCFCKLVFESTTNPSRQTLSNRDTIFVKMAKVDEKGYNFEAKVLGRDVTGRVNKIEE